MSIPSPSLSSPLTGRYVHHSGQHVYERFVSADAVCPHTFV